jgi:hypothetical protein
MDTVWYRCTLFITLSVATTFKLNIDWPYYHELTGTIVHVLAIITVLWGVVVNRKSILNQIKSIFKIK